MKKGKNLLLTLIVLFSLTSINKVTAQSVDVNWSHTYGGSSFDHAMSSKNTSDGGFITVGVTESNDKDVSNPIGGEDIWVIKTNSEGILEWENTYGGSDYDRGFDIVQTDDNGFIIAGSTWSDDGDILENKGGSDLLVIKIDENGNVEWTKTYGGSGDDGAATIIQSQDGNFVIAGTTSSNNGDVSNHKGDLDIWVIKISPTGTLIWENTYGGTDQDWTKSIQQTSDNGFVIGGTTRSGNGDISSPIKWDDVWVVKIDESGQIEWEKTFGGTDYEVANAIQQTEDDGYIVAGYTWSDDGHVSELYGNKDVWILKLDAQGNLEWEKTYGGAQGDGAYAVEIVDGGYVFQANTASSDFDVSNHMGSDDVWIVKIDNAGEILWEKTLGGSAKDWAESMIIDGDSFVISGYTASNDFDITENKGATDFWIISVKEDSIDEGDCTWTVVVQDIDYFGDEVTWELRDSNGDVLLSGGGYYDGYYDEQTVVSDGPVEFYISAIGSENDNKPAYSVSNDNGIIIWGVTVGGTENTFSDLNCSDAAWVEDYSCEEQRMTTEVIEIAYEISGENLNNRLALDIPVNDQGLTLDGIVLNFFVRHLNDTEFNFILHNDDDGKPGDEIATRSSQILDTTLLGNAFDNRNLYEFQVKFSEELELDPNQRYWLEVVADEGAWQALYGTPIGKGMSWNNDYTDGEWLVDPTSEFIYTLVCDGSLGVNDLNQFDFSYYPNPVQDVLNIQSNKSIESISIFDLSGRQFKVQSTKDLNSTKVNLNHLSSGLYLVKVILENNQVETFKVIKK